MGCINCLNNNYNNGNNELLTNPKDENNSSFNEQNNYNILYKKKETIISNDYRHLSSKKIENININPEVLQEEKDEKFNMEILNEINKYRLKHGVDELILDKKISKISQKYAEKCAREKELELSGNKYNDNELGEIIFCCNKEISPKELVDIWYNEGSENYNYNKEPDISNNFTQLIWKSSELFGFGKALTKDNKYYFVANFYPEGNIKGLFLENVFPLTSKNNLSKNYSETNSLYSVNTKFLEEILNAHNEIRLKHNSPPLKLNPSLSMIAQNYAEKLCDIKKLIKSGSMFYNQKLGENLFFSENNCTGEEVTLYWYKGRKNYDFNNLSKNKKNEENDNFTQLIWKNTKEVGFGFNHDNDGNLYVVANYYPCGNIKGQYKNNVLSD